MNKTCYVVLGITLGILPTLASAQKLLKFPPEVVKTAPKPTATTPVAPTSRNLTPPALSGAAQLAAHNAIAAQYASVEKATIANNLPGIMKVVARDFQYYDLEGTVTDRVGYERLQAETLKTRTKLRYRYTIKNIEWRGRDAVVQVENRATGIYDWKRFDLRTTSRDFWSPSPNGWLIRQRVDASIRGFINGQFVSG